MTSSHVQLATDQTNQEYVEIIIELQKVYSSDGIKNMVAKRNVI